MTPSQIGTDGDNDNDALAEIDCEQLAELEGDADSDVE